MSKKDAKTDNSGNNKNRNWIVTAIIFMLVIAVGVCAGIFGGADKRLPQGEIQVFSYDPRVYYTEGKPQKEFYIKAGIVYKDGTIDDNMQNLSFTTNNAAVKVDPNGQIKVTEEIFGDDADQNAVENVMINIKPKDPSSVYIAKDAEATVTVELRPYPKYNITLDTNVFDGNDGNFTQTVGVWEGADVKVDNAQRTLFDDQEFQTKLRLLDDDNDVDGWKFEGWYMLSVNDQLEDEAFDFTESYYWGKDITLRARYSADLVLDDDMPEVEKDSTLNKVYYNEPLKRQLSLLDTENGWTFAGWFSQQAGEGNQYTTSNQIFAERVPHLYAKWTSNKVTCINELDGTQQNGVSVVWNGNFDFDTSIFDFSDGRFAYWVTKDEERETEQFKDNNYKYTLASNDTLYAKTRFTLTIDYQDADSSPEKNAYDVVYNTRSGVNLPELQKNTWNFDGYYIKNDDNKYEIGEDDVFNYKTNLNLYVKWKSTLTVYGIIDGALKVNEKSINIDIYYNNPLPVDESILSGTSINGWTFDGWIVGQNININEVGEDYDMAEIYDEKDLVNNIDLYTGNGSIAAYARWSGEIQFQTILKESSFENDAATTMTVYYSTKLKQLPRLYNNGISDYNFYGWYDVPSSDTNTTMLGDKLSEGDLFKYKIEGGNKKFYEVAQFSLSFDMNGASSTQVEDLKVFYRKTIGVALQESDRSWNEINTNIQNGAWHFGGWYYDDEMKKKIDEDYVLQDANSMEVKARWESTVTLHLVNDDNWEAMKNDFADKSVVKVYVPYGEQLESYLSEDLRAPSWGDWQHSGWSTNKDHVSNDMYYYNNEEITSSTLELYSIWKTSPELHYCDDSGTLKKINDMIYGKSIGGSSFNGYFSEVKALSKTGYMWSEEEQYKCLYTKEDYSESIGANTSIYPKFITNLYIKWAPKTYTVKLKDYHYSKGTGTYTDETITATYGERLPVPKTTSEDRREGTMISEYKYNDKTYLRAGSRNGQETSFIVDGCSIWEIDTDSIELTPKTAVAGQTVTLKGYDGNENGFDIFGFTDAPLMPLDASKAPTKNGYKFVGYYNVEGNEGGTQYYDENMNYCKDGNWDINDTILYPRFEAIRYDVTLKDYSAEGDMTVDGYVDRKLNNLTNPPTKEGHTFVGYYKIDDQGRETQYYDENMNYCKDGNWDINDTILYPKFTVNSYKITIINKEDYRLRASASITGGTLSDSNPMSVESGLTDGHVLCKVTYDAQVTLRLLSEDCKSRVRGWTPQELSVTSTGNWSYGFKMPASDVTITIGCDQNHCVTPDTLITLADRTQKRVEDLKGDEMLLVWNLFTGQFDAAPILFVDSDEKEMFEIINLRFSDGTAVKVIYEHGFWDYDLNEWVFLRSDASKYIGHWFNKQALDGSGNMVNQRVQLVEVELTYEETTAWSPVTFGHLCYYVNGMLSMPGATEGLINIFDVDPETMKFDEEKMAADIEKYGLFTYDDFKDLIPEAVYEAFNGAYLKVAIGKGILTWNMLEALILRYADFWTV